jgi:hypothetical protein
MTQHLDDTVALVTHRAAASAPQPAAGWSPKAQPLPWSPTRERRVAVNEMLIRAGEQNW